MNFNIKLNLILGTLCLIIMLALLPLAHAQTTTFKSISDGFQISVPAANFKQIGTENKTTRDGFPVIVTNYAGDNPQGDYIVVVATYDREITKERFLELANTQRGEPVTSKDDLDFDGQYGVLRLVRTPQGKMANWMTYKGNKFYQIIFGSGLTAEQINFDEVNAFVNSFKFYGCFLPEGCK
jgi:hypothetical protein